MDVQVKYSYLQFALEPTVVTHIGKVITLILQCQVMNIIVTQCDTQKTKALKLLPINVTFMACSCARFSCYVELWYLPL